MDELVKLVAQKTGLSQDQSKMAVTVVLDYLKKKLPEPLAGQIDAGLSGEGLNLAQGLESLLGKK